MLFAIVALVALSGCNGQSDKAKLELEKAKVEAEKAKLELEKAKLEANGGQPEATGQSAAVPKGESAIAKEAYTSNVETWAGAIGGKYKIHMMYNRSTGEMWYYYDKNGPNAKLWLTVTDSGGGHLAMYETNKHGEMTGEFDGHVSGNTYSGSFVTYHKGTQYYSFTMRRVN